MTNSILRPGYLRWDGTKYVLDPSVEIVGPPGPPGPQGPPGLATGPAGGDLSGGYPNPTVVGIQHVPVVSTVPTAGQGLVFNGTQWAPTAVISGSAGGDLSGLYPNPTVAKIDGASVPAAGSLTTGNVLQVSGASSLIYAPLNLAGGVNFVTGILPAGNQAAQSMGGDVSGTTASAVVNKINGVSVTGTPSPGQSIIATGTSSASWHTPFEFVTMMVFQQGGIQVDNVYTTWTSLMAAIQAQISDGYGGIVTVLVDDSLTGGGGCNADAGTWNLNSRVKFVGANGPWGGQSDFSNLTTLNFPTGTTINDPLSFTDLNLVNKSTSGGSSYIIDSVSAVGLVITFDGCRVRCNSGVSAHFIHATTNSTINFRGTSSTTKAGSATGFPIQGPSTGSGTAYIELYDNVSIGSNTISFATTGTTLLEVDILDRSVSFTTNQPNITGTNFTIINASNILTSPFAGTITSNYTMSDADEFIPVDDTSGDVTVTLTTDSGLLPGLQVIVADVGVSDIHTVTVSGGGKNIIFNNTPTASISLTPGQMVFFVYNGSSWSAK